MGESLTARGALRSLNYRAMFLTNETFDIGSCSVQSHIFQVHWNHVFSPQNVNAMLQTAHADIQ